MFRPRIVPVDCSQSPTALRKEVKNLKDTIAQQVGEREFLLEVHNKQTADIRVAEKNYSQLRIAYAELEKEYKALQATIGANDVTGEVRVLHNALEIAEKENALLREQIALQQEQLDSLAAQRTLTAQNLQKAQSVNAFLERESRKMQRALFNQRAEIDLKNRTLSSYQQQLHAASAKISLFSKPVGISEDNEQPSRDRQGALPERSVSPP